MKKYGFFGGSFNPVTKAHVDLAIEIVEKYNLDKVIFVPVGNHYIKEGLINEKHRYNMLKIATGKYKVLEVSDIELNQDKNLTTLEAFRKIEEQYEEIEKYYIIGGDNLYKILSSEDSDALINNYKYIVIQRNTKEIKDLINTNKEIIENKNNFIIMENIKHSETSSTKVRNGITEKNKKVAEIMDTEVLDYIEKNKLYIN